MFHRIILSLIAMWLTSVGIAKAEYSFCNKTSYALSASIGYVEEGRLITRGWWRLRPGQCKVVMTEEINPGRYFVYAEAIPGHRGPLRTWSGDTPLCVENESLFTLRDQDVCASDPRRQREFFPVDVSEDNDGSWRTEFAEEVNYNVYKAEVAGVQRLLRDVGYDVSRIDGSLGRQTQTTLRQFRQDRGLGDSGVYDDALIDQLILEANERDAKLGFFFCNATQLPIWAAIAQTDEEDGYRSSGWWRMEGSECAKVLRGELTNNHYYVYGIMDLGDRDIGLAGGDKDFCVSDVQFDAAGDIECSESGYQNARFRKVEIGGERAWTYQFSPDQFNPEISASTAPQPSVSRDPVEEDSSAEATEQ
ncbi:DUF1036 domain-containing protein [Parvularcula sp. IMCC14364]|uniref:DUF1036 domain-containing protein n=1 Tax=Parvularcula sp. IMCC14364 TaxID=3067902 RepID=UPI00274126D4|nr:DUF1036 domain-containing protein [Parvularcula sp. IMCC14364]